VQHLIRLSQNLLTIAERETQALLTNDMLAFSIMQYEKEKVTGQYVTASQAFRDRLEEFRNTDRGLLDRLEKLQKDLSVKSNDNNRLVEQMRHRAHANTQKSMGTLRDLSQGVHVRYDEIQKSANQIEGA
jgi:anion-transporting  ArsA/GET3 family ATPase